MRSAAKIVITATLAGGLLASFFPMPSSSAEGLMGSGAARLVSTATGNDAKATGNATATNPDTSADGHFVVFESSATNLVTDATSTSQIYLRDTITNVTTLVSKQRGTIGNGNSSEPSISADGRYVAFVSSSTNLAPGTSGANQIFVWDRITAALVLASATDGGSTPGDSYSIEPEISADGTTVAFASRASNLTAEATIGLQVFVRNLRNNSTELVSVDPLSPTPAGAICPAHGPSTSEDGNLVSFLCAAQLTALSTRGSVQVYVRNRRADTTTLVSLSVDKTSGVDADVVTAQMAAGGDAVGYISSARNATADPLGPGSRAFVYDLAGGATSIASRNQWNEIVDAADLAIASSGERIAFVSVLSDITAGTSSDGPQVYVRDLQVNDTLLGSRSWTGGGGSIATDTRGVPISLAADGATVVFSKQALNVVEGVLPASPQVFSAPLDFASGVVRVGGANRFEVSSAISRGLFTESSNLPIYIASGERYPDALSAMTAAAAGQRAVKSPLLLVPHDGVPASVAAELQRYRPNGVTIIGGSLAVDDTVLAEIERLTGKRPDRIDGPDRFAVSAKTSANTFPTGSKVAYVASGENYPDALVAGAAAGFGRGPVLLTRKDEVPAAISDELARLKPDKIVVLGGPAAVSDDTKAKLDAIAPTTRISGADRFAVAANTSAATFAEHTRVVYIASGENFPDALSSGAAAAANRGPVLLVRKDAIPADIAAELKRLDPRKIIVVGGTAAISDSVVTQLNSFLRKE